MNNSVFLDMTQGTATDYGSSRVLLNVHSTTLQEFPCQNTIIF